MDKVKEVEEVLSKIDAELGTFTDTHKLFAEEWLEGYGVPTQQVQNTLVLFGYRCSKHIEQVALDVDLECRVVYYTLLIKKKHLSEYKKYKKALEFVRSRQADQKKDSGPLLKGKRKRGLSHRINKWVAETREEAKDVALKSAELFLIKYRGEELNIEENLRKYLQNYPFTANYKVEIELVGE